MTQQPFKSEHIGTDWINATYTRDDPKNGNEVMIHAVTSNCREVVVRAGDFAAAVQRDPSLVGRLLPGVASGLGISGWNPPTQ